MFHSPWSVIFIMSLFFLEQWKDRIRSWHFLGIPWHVLISLQDCMRPYGILIWLCILIKKDLNEGKFTDYFVQWRYKDDWTKYYYAGCLWQTRQGFGRVPFSQIAMCFFMFITPCLSCVKMTVRRSKLLHNVIKRISCKKLGNESVHSEGVLLPGQINKSLLFCQS